MHDCLKTKEDLIDLVFNEVDAARELRILEELEACRACRHEYRSMTEALGKFDEAATALLPAVEFWADYHAGLEARLDAAVGARKTSTPFWRRTLQTSFSVPVPVAIAAALLFAAVSALAVRAYISQPKLRPAMSAASAAVQYIEVPVEKRVVEERVVTRTIYLTKRAASRSNQNAPTVEDLQNMTAKKAKDETINPARSTLNGFQPPSDVRLTVIKGSFKDEK